MDLDLVQLLHDAILHSNRPMLIRWIRSLVVAFFDIKS
jgi:hypothetical protein